MENKDNIFYKNKYIKYANSKGISLEQMFYRKYLLYKQKYLQLKHKGGQNTFDDINTNLYLLFTSEKLVARDPDEMIGGGKRKASDEFSTPIAKTSKYPIRIRNQPGYLIDYVQDLTPNILRYLTPQSKTRMESDIEIDNKIIETLNQMEEAEDDDYVQYENYGKLIECWIGDNMRCPCCGSKSLRRYLKDSMPVIDIVCINPAHTLDLGVKFFQVKASNGSLFRSKPYFLYDSSKNSPDYNTIHVGSRKWGEPVHLISPHDDQFTKKILCGYICVGYVENESTLTINLFNTFIVLPKYLENFSTTRQVLTFDSDLKAVSSINVDDWYYRYVEPNGSHNRIEFNPNTNNVLVSASVQSLLPGLTLSKSYQIKTSPMTNPLNLLLV